MGLPKLPPCPYPQTPLFLTTFVFPSCTQDSALHPRLSFWLLEYLSHQDINYKYFTASLILPIPLIFPRNTETSSTHFHYTQKNPKTKGIHPSLYPVCPPRSSFLFPWPSNFMRHQGYLSPMASPAIPSSTHCDLASTLMTTQKLLSSRWPITFAASDHFSSNLIGHLCSIWCCWPPLPTSKVSVHSLAHLLVLWQFFSVLFPLLKWWCFLNLVFSLH